MLVPFDRRPVVRHYLAPAYTRNDQIELQNEYLLLCSCSLLYCCLSSKREFFDREVKAAKQVMLNVHERQTSMERSLACPSEDHSSPLAVPNYEQLLSPEELDTIIHRQMRNSISMLGHFLESLNDDKTLYVTCYLLTCTQSSVFKCSKLY